ncbi:uncharacterized protein METZ01_LOCUS57312 [marine metagenome]|uniref:Uncharacterized protein n=1 Tax=marine metagenome TaxID=408172 RepID=A0A381SME0_9ZZZZ
MDNMDDFQFGHKKNGDFIFFCNFSSGDFFPIHFIITIDPTTSFEILIRKYYKRTVRRIYFLYFTGHGPLKYRR